MVELLLHQRFESSTAEDTSAALEAVFGDAVASIEGAGTLAYSQHSLVDDGISVTRISSAGAALQVAVSHADDLLVMVVRKGVVSATVAGQHSEWSSGALGLIPLNGAAQLRWVNVELDVVSFPRSSLGRLLGTPAHVLAPAVAQTVVSNKMVASLWHKALAVVADVLASRELYESDMIRDQSIGALLGISIEAFGISDSTEDSLPDAHELRLAETFMTTHLGESIAVVDIARAVGLSVRGLQLAYRRSGQGTPVMHLRQLRMTAAHDWLSTPDSSGKVSDVARSLSYRNIGRFRAHYREAFGEVPEATLDQARTDAAAQDGLSGDDRPVTTDDPAVMALKRRAIAHKFEITTDSDSLTLLRGSVVLSESLTRDGLDKLHSRLDEWDRATV